MIILSIYNTTILFSCNSSTHYLSLADFPDEDLIVLDEDSSGLISSKEFVTFFADGTNVRTDIFVIQIKESFKSADDVRTIGPHTDGRLK